MTVATANCQIKRREEEGELTQTGRRHEHVVDAEKDAITGIGFSLDYLCTTVTGRVNADPESVVTCSDPHTLGCTTEGAARDREPGWVGRRLSGRGFGGGAGKEEGVLDGDGVGAELGLGKEGVVEEVVEELLSELVLDIVWEERSVGEAADKGAEELVTF
jgi:hypothetical protein